MSSGVKYEECYVRHCVVFLWNKGEVLLPHQKKAFAHCKALRVELLGIILIINHKKLINKEQSWLSFDPSLVLMLEFIHKWVPIGHSIASCHAHSPRPCGPLSHHPYHWQIKRPLLSKVIAKNKIEWEDTHEDEDDLVINSSCNVMVVVKNKIEWWLQTYI